MKFYRVKLVIAVL